MRRQSLSQVACSKDMFRKESSFSRLSLPWACWRQRTGTEMAFLRCRLALVRLHSSLQVSLGRPRLTARENTFVHSVHFTDTKMSGLLEMLMCKSRQND